MKNRCAHYVLSTHWDREWYQPFQHFRYRLVQLLDRVLEGLAAGRLLGPFQTDGQAIVLEDYLEVRPERRRQIEQLAQQRKLIIGPWYVLPDEFLVSGESILRNLRLGREVAREFGAKPSNAGFVCDLFGHNSQMPQILAGFGIKGGFIWRGVNTPEIRHFRWRGADGTELPCYRFSHFGYCAFAFEVRHAHQPHHVFDHQQAATDLELFIRKEAGQTEVEQILLFDGADHQEWDQQVYRVLVERMQRAEDGFEIVHTCLDDYLAEMLPQAGRIKTVIAGELREPGKLDNKVDNQWLIPGVLSSRVWIKKANAECQTLLCHWAEPFSAFAHVALSREYPQGFLEVAWKWLLQNHPHDSICGCSSDAVHEDMKYRFSQCRQIAERLTNEAIRKIAASIAGEVNEDELRVVVFNPLPQKLEQTIELWLQIPAEWPTFNEFFGFEPKPAFRIYDAQGHEIPYQRLAQNMNLSKVRFFDTKFAQEYKTHDVHVSLPITIPGIGYTTLTVRRGEPNKPTRYPAAPGLATSERSMENEFLAVTIETNGTLTILDKRNGQIYSRLLTFEDNADIGDGWYHGVAVGDQVFCSTACHSDVAQIHNGPLLAAFRIRTKMFVPAEFYFDRMVRSEQPVELVIESLVSLRRGTDRVEVQTTVHNNAKDHRLRVLFPSGAQAQTYLADSPFDVVERPIALNQDNHLYRELEVETKPQQSWTAVHEAQRGLAIISTGLMETAVRDLPERPIALTLFRSTRRTVMTDGEPNGQLIGTMHFHYWITPLTREPDRSKLCQWGQLLAAGWREMQLRQRDVMLHREKTTLPPSVSFMQVDGAAVVSSVRQVGYDLEVRMFNPTDRTIRTIVGLRELLQSTKHFTRIQQVDFESNPLEPAQTFDDGKIELALLPKKIVTVRFS